MKSIGTLELKQLFDRGENFSLINVLPPIESETTLIPGSTNIPVRDGDFCEKVTELVPSKDAQVIVYSESSECDLANKAAEKLDEAGFSDVSVYQGGARAWKLKGGFLAKSRSR